MGMYDEIDYECECPFCGSLLKGFQSKDGPCDFLTLKPEEVRRFYTSCDNCGKWVEYKVIPAPPIGLELVKDHAFNRANEK